MPGTRVSAPTRLPRAGPGWPQQNGKLCGCLGHPLHSIRQSGRPGATCWVGDWMQAAPVQTHTCHLLARTPDDTWDLCAESPCPHSGVTLASSSGGCEDAMHE